MIDRCHHQFCWIIAWILCWHYKESCPHQVINIFTFAYFSLDGAVSDQHSSLISTSSSYNHYLERSSSACFLFFIRFLSLSNHPPPGFACFILLVDADTLFSAETLALLGKCSELVLGLEKALEGIRSGTEWCLAIGTFTLLLDTRTGPSEPHSEIFRVRPVQEVLHSEVFRARLDL